MVSIQSFNRLQFDDDTIFDDQISHVTSHGGAFVADLEWSFLLCGKSAQNQFMQQCLAIDSFEKAMAKYIGDLKGCADNAFGQFLARSVDLDIHPCLSVSIRVISFPFFFPGHRPFLDAGQMQVVGIFRRTVGMGAGLIGGVGIVESGDQAVQAFQRVVSQLLGIGAG